MNIANYKIFGMRRQSGFSLIELMVALVIGMVLTIAVLLLQSRMSAQNSTVSDVGLRDNEARAAMDTITRDMASSGYLFGGLLSSTPCLALIGYNSGAKNTSIAYYPVTGVNSVAKGSTLASISPTASLTFQYPTTASGNRSDVFLVQSTTTTLAAVGTTTLPALQVNGASSLSSSALTVTYLPLASGNATTATSGDVGVLVVTGSTPTLCIRTPLSTVTSTTIQGSGSTWPGSWGGYATAINASITSTATITATNLGASYIYDVGSSSTPSQLVHGYFVDVNTNLTNAPRLEQVTINPLNDQVMGTQDIAIGVVSLQVLFGVDPTSSGSVTQYVNASKLQTNLSNVTNVRSVKILMVYRSIYPDPNFNVAGTVTPVSVKSAYSPPTATYPGSDSFQDYTPLSTEVHNHFSVIETEIAVRNNIWATK